MEAAELGSFMLSACCVTTLFFHPASPAVAAIPDPTVRRVLTGAAMGLTGIAIVYSPFGKRSGAHFLPLAMSHASSMRRRFISPAVSR